MEASQKYSCPREENFGDMYKFLGSAEDQEYFRKVNPKSSHCAFLKECPNACEAMPKDIGEAKKGERCPNNPLVRHKEVFQKLDEEYDLIEEALHYEGLISLNMMPTSLDEINPIEYQIAICVKQFMDSKELMVKSMSNIGLGLGVKKGDGN